MLTSQPEQQRRRVVLHRPRQRPLAARRGSSISPATRAEPRDRGSPRLRVPWRTCCTAGLHERPSSSPGRAPARHPALGCTRRRPRGPHGAGLEPSWAGCSDRICHLDAESSEEDCCNLWAAIIPDVRGPGESVRGVAEQVAEVSLATRNGARSACAPGVEPATEPFRTLSRFGRFRMFARPR